MAILRSRQLPSPAFYEARMDASYLDPESAAYDPDAANAFWQAYHVSMQPPTTLAWHLKWFCFRSKRRLADILSTRSLRVDPTTPF